MPPPSSEFKVMEAFILCMQQLCKLNCIFLSRNESKIGKKLLYHRCDDNISPFFPQKFLVVRAMRFIIKSQLALGRNNKIPVSDLIRYGNQIIGLLNSMFIMKTIILLQWDQQCRRSTVLPVLRTLPRRTQYWSGSGFNEYLRTIFCFNN